jgi:hypothetical protein
MLRLGVLQSQMQPILANHLRARHRQTPYGADPDFVFPSLTTSSTSLLFYDSHLPSAGPLPSSPEFPKSRAFFITVIVPKRDPIEDFLIT